MRARARRKFVRRPPDLTSLFDVMFIVVFVALIRAAAAQNAAAEAAAPPPPKLVVTPPPAPPPLPVEVAALRTRALANLNSELETRTSVVVRVSAKGTVEAIESGARKIVVDVPLLELSADQFVMSYLGDRSAELRMCRIATVHLGLTDLSRHVVIVAPAQVPAEMIVALNEGLARDVGRCLVDQRGLAVIVSPEPLKAAP